MDSKKPNLPLSSAGQNFLWSFVDEVCQKPKKPENFCKKRSKSLIVCTRWKGNCL